MTLDFTASQENSNGGHVNLSIKPIGKPRHRREGAAVYTIYCHTHRDSARRYVGQTVKTMEQRWAGHVSDASRGRGCAYLAAAIRKYGAESFDHDVLETCASRSEANLAESKWIEHFMSNEAECGFNLTSGGDTAFELNDAARARLAIAIRAGLERIGPAARSERPHKRAVTMGREKLLAAHHKGLATLGAAGRKALIKKSNTTLGPDGRSARSLKRAETIGVEALSAMAVDRDRRMGPDKTAERSHNSRASRMAKFNAMTPEEQAQEKERQRIKSTITRASRASDRLAAHAKKAA